MSCAAQAWHTIGGTRSHLPPWRRTVLAGSDEPHGVFELMPLPADGIYEEPPNQTTSTSRPIKCEVVRSGGALGTVNVALVTGKVEGAIADATERVGYTNITTILKFLENETSKTVTFYLAPDATPELDEYGRTKIDIADATLNMLAFDADKPNTLQSPRTVNTTETQDFITTNNDYPNGVVYADESVWR